jgi:hypothetical protein
MTSTGRRGVLARGKTDRAIRPASAIVMPVLQLSALSCQLSVLSSQRSADEKLLKAES